MILEVPRKNFRVCFLNSRPFFAGALFFCLRSTTLWNKALFNSGFLGNDLIPFAGFTLSDSVSNYNGSHVSCKGSSDGSIDLTVTGGVSPFTYSWSDGSTLEDLAGLTAGVYQVLVTDSIGDLDSLTVFLTETDEILVDFSDIHIICNNSNGSITVLVRGGTGNYQYSWSNGFTI